MNPISKYLKEANVSAAALARAVGVTPQTISRMAHGLRKPSPALTRKIEAATGIPRHEIRPDVYEAAQ